MNDALYNEAVFYVMSGTGNTYRVSRWIEEIAARHKIESRLILIEDADFDIDLNPKPDTLIGLLFPTHGFMPPWSMIKFLFRIPRRKNMPAICVATRGALKIGPLQIPGTSGFATFFAALVMLLKGFCIRAIFSLDMPSNFINFHWGLHPDNVDEISNKTRTRLNQLIPRILIGRRIFFTRNNFWEAMWTTVLFWLVPLYPIFYLIFARMFMAKVMFSNRNCIGCGACALACPNKAIVMKDAGSKKKPFWTYHCENCMRCMGYCRKKAVEAGHSWAVALYFITAVPVISFLWVWLHQSLNFYPVISGYWTAGMINVFNFLVYVVYFWAAVILSYGIFWYLLRFSFFNTLFTMTTLTHYYRRYHQPQTRLKHLMSRKKRNQRTDHQDAVGSPQQSP